MILTLPYKNLLGRNRYFLKNVSQIVIRYFKYANQSLMCETYVLHTVLNYYFRIAVPAHRVPVIHLRRKIVLEVLSNRQPVTSSPMLLTPTTMLVMHLVRKSVKHIHEFTRKKKSIFDQNFDFWQKVLISDKISIFDQNFYFWHKLRFLTKNLNFRPKL